MGSVKKAATKLLSLTMIHSRTLASSPTTTTLPHPLIINNNKTPFCYSTHSLNPILRPPPPLTYAPPRISFSSKTMSTNQSSAATVPDHDTLLKQKRTLRTKVKSDLKSMDPAQRAHEGRLLSLFIFNCIVYVFV